MNRYTQLRAAMKRTVNPTQGEGQWNGEFTLFSTDRAVSVGFMKYVGKDPLPEEWTKDIFVELEDFTKEHPNMLILLRWDVANEMHIVIQAGAWFSISNEVASLVNGDVLRQNELNYPMYIEFLSERAEIAYNLSEFDMADVTESIVPNNKLGAAYRELSRIQQGYQNQFSQQGSQNHGQWNGANPGNMMSGMHGNMFNPYNRNRRNNNQY